MAAIETSTLHSPTDSSGVRWTPFNPNGLQRTPPESSLSQECHILESAGVHWGLSGVRQTPVDSSGLRRTPVDSSELQWTPPDSSGLRRIPVDSSGLRRNPTKDKTLLTPFILCMFLEIGTLTN